MGSAVTTHAMNRPERLLLFKERRMLELFRSPRRAIVWFVEASLLSLLALAAAAWMRGWTHALGYEHVLRALVICAVAQASIYYHGLYAPRPIPARQLVLG